MENFSEKLLQLIKEKGPNSINTLDSLCDQLEIREYSFKNEVQKALDGLCENGDLIFDRRGGYSLIEYKGMYRGVLDGNPRGFAFVRPENDTIPDFFIPHDNLNGALHGDTVLVSRDLVEMSGDVGYVVKVLKRGFSEIVGTFQEERYCGFVIPEDRRYFSDIYIPKSLFLNAKNGMKVVAKITNYKGKNPEGRISEILGYPKEKGIDILTIIKGHNVRTEFNEQIQKELQSIPDKVTNKQLFDRSDFRDLVTFTIDGDDSKDFDDAISISKNPNGTYLLGVHIADVTEYVRYGSNLDKEANERGTSIYFVDRVVPMLPEKLSNGICSLNEGEDRLTLSCMMTIDNKGEVVDSEIVKAVINSHARLTYSKVTKIIEGNEELAKEYSNVYSSIMLANELATILIKKREQEGAIDFDTPESKIRLDALGRAIDVVPYERGISNRIIEEFMILANCVVAEKLYYFELPCIYRVHQQPDEDKLDNFVSFLQALGIKFRFSQNGIHSKDFSKLLESLQDNMLYLIVNKVMLRTMQKAKYSNIQSAHFGLSKEYYCHFTSPIRRYPDLFVHRMLKLMIEGNFTNDLIDKYFDIAGEVASHSSEMERKADEVERDVDEFKKCEFMGTVLGEVYEGIISGVTRYGFYVELPNTCEGMVRVDTLNDDNIVYNEKMYSLSSPHQSYVLGQKVKIQVVAADKATRRVDFIVLE